MVSLGRYQYKESDRKIVEVRVVGYLFKPHFCVLVSFANGKKLRRVRVDEFAARAIPLDKRVR